MIPPVVVVSYHSVYLSQTTKVKAKKYTHRHRRAEAVELARDGRVFPVYRIELAAEVYANPGSRC